MSRHAARRRRYANDSATILVIILASMFASRPAFAHDRKEVGSFRLVIGWGDEPSYSGLKNAIEVDVAAMDGNPIADLADSLSVDVLFGDQHVLLPLRPARGQPGRVRAILQPTRPGTYAFHITGTVKGEAIDTTSTCSDHTFSCVLDISDIQFPVKDPSVGQIADRMGRELPRAEAAAGTAVNARRLSIAALALAAAAFAAAVARRRRTGKPGD